MRDLAVLAIVVGAIGLTLRRPWTGVLVLAVFSYMNPHSYAWGPMRVFPAYQTLFIVAVVAFLATRDKQPLPRDWRVPTFFILWLYFVLTTFYATVPDFAWPKLIEVSKIYAPFLLTLWLINTREKLRYLIYTIAASFGIIGVKGGLWAIRTGFSNRVYGPPGTQFYGNNEFAVALIMGIPLLILWMRETENKWIRYGIMAAIPVCFGAVLCSWSRGALISVVATGLVLLWNSRRKYLAIPLAVAGIYLALGHLPEEWFARMETIETYQEDSSAQKRLIVWRDGFEYALSRPLVGAGFEGWRYVTTSDWHSSYIEILAEHGFVAFGMWFSLLFGTLVSLTWLPQRTGGVPGMEWVANYCYMLRASLIAYATGTIFLGLSYWDIFYHIVFISVLVKQFAMEELDNRIHELEQDGRPASMSPDYSASTEAPPGDSSQ